MAFEHKREKLKKEISNVLNRLGIDNDLDTPVLLLAEYVVIRLESLEFEKGERRKFIEDLIEGQAIVEAAISND